ncbi:MAG: ankyrin repeat domain-containing protein [Verrucomicrobia bacterium]|nr:ankyrin repeat domain-containing protein [Verrucomicrobiota bacterium]
MRSTTHTQWPQMATICACARVVAVEFYRCEGNPGRTAMRSLPTCQPPIEGALVLAALKGQTLILNALLRAGAEVNKCTTDGTTPLIAAVSGCSEQIVTLLLEKAQM